MTLGRVSQMIYDIFISYKHSDENGKVTHDYDIELKLNPFYVEQATVL